MEARLLLFRGDSAGAAAITVRIRDQQAELKARSEPDVLMAPSEAVICDMVELATQDAAADAWDALESRSERFSIGQERIEVIETRALAAHRSRRTDEALHHLRRALDLAAQIPNAMGGRLRRRVDDLHRH